MSIVENGQCCAVSGCHATDEIDVAQIWAGLSWHRVSSRAPRNTPSDDIEIQKKIPPK